MGESVAAIYREELPEMLDILYPSEEENNNLVVDTQVLRIQNQRRMLHERFNYANSLSSSNSHHSHSNGIILNATSTSNCVVTSPVLPPHRCRSIVHTTPPQSFSDPDFDDDVVHNGHSTAVTTIPQQQQAPSPMVPDLLRDWESITEEEIDNFISTEE